MEYWEEMKAEAAAEDRAARIYHARLMAHPDPRDPDYPGPDCDEAESKTKECPMCGGSGWMPRDPDIGTEQECFVCDATGLVEAEDDE
jgi:hypothetical protein